MKLEVVKSCGATQTVQYTEAIFLKINAKSLEHPGPCSVLGAGHNQSIKPITP